MSKYGLDSRVRHVDVTARIAPDRRSRRFVIEAVHPASAFRAVCPCRCTRRTSPAAEWSMLVLSVPGGIGCRRNVLPCEFFRSKPCRRRDSPGRDCRTCGSLARCRRRARSCRRRRSERCKRPSRSACTAPRTARANEQPAQRERMAGDAGAATQTPRDVSRWRCHIGAFPPRSGASGRNSWNVLPILAFLT